MIFLYFNDDDYRNRSIIIHLGVNGEFSPWKFAYWQIKILMKLCCWWEHVAKSLIQISNCWKLVFQIWANLQIHSFPTKNKMSNYLTVNKCFKNFLKIKKFTWLAKIFATTFSYDTLSRYLSCWESRYYYQK